METSRAEAERLLGIAEKLLRNKDYGGCRDFSILAQETEPLLDGSDQILAVAEVLLASEKHSSTDWYSVLQLPPRTDDPDLIKKQYRRLALLLHPDKNKFPFSDSAFRLVADSWAVLSDPSKKAAYDSELAASASRFTKADFLSRKQPKPSSRGDGDHSNQKLPIRRSARSAGPTPTPAPAPRTNNVVGSFWTACPYCYNLYEYPRVYEGCCLRCDSENCKRAFTATPIVSMPPVVPGQEAYYCCWGFFPMGFTAGGLGKGNNGFGKWMPPMFGEGAAVEVEVEVERRDQQPPAAVVPENVMPVSTAAPAPAVVVSVAKKRGRPKKNV